jgi:thioredoxin 1
MPEPITLTDANVNEVLSDSKPILILSTTGEGLRGDFKVAFNKMAQDEKRYTFARLDPLQNPKTAARFNLGEKPVLIGLYCGEEIVRRLRPWGSDLPLAVEMLQQSESSQTPPAAPVVEQKKEEVTAEQEKIKVVNNKPVVVTDATFEQEVLNSDIPVLVDFWAAWCGPCRMVAPILDKLAGEFAGQIKIAKVDVDANPALSQAFRIMSIPNLMIVKQRTIIFNQPGALPEASMRDLIKQAIALQIPPRAEEEQPNAEEQPAAEQQPSE